MQIDVPTLYYLIVGTTATAAGLTYWERRSNAAHRHELGLWALGYFLISLGCLLRISGPDMPAIVLLGLSNVAVCSGYVAISWGTLRFIERPFARFWLPVLTLLSLAWLIWGIHLPTATRIVLTSMPVAVFSLWVAVALFLRSKGRKPLPSQHLAAGLFAVHGAFFAIRVVVTALADGTELALWSNNIMLTMFEGILWSASAPMTLLVLVREKTERQLLEASQIDYLTGLDNRRGLFRKAERVFAQSANAERPTVLLVFDLDHFKSINDRFGHQAGDRVLELFSRIAEAETRSQDVVARLGGEEFAILLPATDPLEGRTVAARISRRFAAEVERPDGLAIMATVSAGLADTRSGPQTLDRLMEAADRGLYRAKELGRNRIEQAALPEAVAA